MARRPSPHVHQGKAALQPSQPVDGRLGTHGGPTGARREGIPGQPAPEKGEGLDRTTEYDFGDGWTHRITLQKILPQDPRVRLPACVAGKRQCPPEDCGGIWGFYEKLRILEDPDDEEYEDIREWMGDDFDPDDFSVDEVNAQLRGMFR